MPTSNRVHLRFAGGSAEGPRSSIWRLFTGKKPRSDVYLAVRDIAGAIKASLHESGQWQVSFTTQFESQLRNLSDSRLASRHIDQWTRPQDISSGLTLAFRIIVPTSELRVMPTTPDKPTCWVPPAPTAWATEFAVLLSRAQIKVLGWPGKRSMRTQLLAKYLLPNLETLWIVYRTHELGKVMRDRIAEHSAALRKGLREWVISNPNLAGPHARIILGGAEPDGSRFFLDMAADTVFSHPWTPPRASVDE